MESAFILKLVLSFLVGGVMVTGCTTAAERFGTEVGGIIGGFPSTVAVTLLFVALVDSPAAAAGATTVIPAVLGLSGFFLFIYALLVRRGILLAFLAGFSFWTIFALLIVLYPPRSLAASLLIFAILVLAAHIGLSHWLRLPFLGRKSVRFSAGQLIFRGLFSGGIIAFAVLMSRLGGPLVGGAMGAFPAAYISSLGIAYLSQGADFSRILTRPLLISGMTNVCLYSIGVRFAYPRWGIVIGTLASFLLAGASAFLLYRFRRVT